MQQIDSILDGLELRPLGEIEEPLPEYFSGTLRTEHERRGLQRLTVSLMRSGARLDDGSFVSSHAKALRWVCQQLGKDVV